eukprot:TRINITY_DN29596_c0_g1_i1.p1 TRINITY_DN29596_c0_g1~~TRINITY_DN29596_c0_g1_i1.p1  ORF type:complete len:150 (-),score=8.62 TRINITY_DN29596_c0_g1_i1:141-590(-)
MGILIKPIITEKATAASELRNCYTFAVNTKANKVEIKKAVEAAYGVSVEKVRTINVRPDRRTRYTKTGIQHGKTNAVKKAIVQLAEGEMIDLYANMQLDKKCQQENQNQSHQDSDLEQQMDLTPLLLTSRRKVFQLRKNVLVVETVKEK